MNKKFDKFVRYCEYWIDKFELNEFEIFFRCDKMDGVRAWNSVELSAMTAELGLNSELCSMMSDKELNSLAFHEVTEILLSFISEPLRSYRSERAVGKEIHRIVHKLWYCVKKQNKGGKFE